MKYRQITFPLSAVSGINFLQMQYLQERPLRKSASCDMSRSARSAPRRVRPASQAGLHEMVRLKAPPTERARQAKRRPVAACGKLIRRPLVVYKCALHKER